MNKILSVVILNWNGAELLKKFLPSVIKHTPSDRAEIVVADNGSSDSSVALLIEQFPKIRIIRFNENLGFAKGYNCALNEIKTPYTVLLNSDVEVTNNWIDRPLELLKNNSQIAAVQPKIVSWNNKNTFEYAGAAGGYIDRLGYPFCRGRILSVIENDNGQYNNEADIFWASGACLFVKTDLYKALGGLDARFFAHQEEIDLCWRIKNMNYKIVFTPNSTIYHVGGATLNQDNPRKTFLNFRNNLLMIYKNLPKKQSRKILFYRFWLDTLAAFHFFIIGQPKNALAIFQAKKEFSKIKKEYTPPTSTNSNIKEIYKKSLLLDFYLKRKKTFSQLKF